MIRPNVEQTKNPRVWPWNKASPRILPTTKTIYANTRIKRLTHKVYGCGVYPTKDKETMEHTLKLYRITYNETYRKNGHPQFRHKIPVALQHPPWTDPNFTAKIETPQKTCKQNDKPASNYNGHNPSHSGRSTRPQKIGVRTQPNILRPGIAVCRRQAPRSP